MIDILKDIVKHTHGLGFLDLVKITGRGYWNYNTKTAMTQMIKDEGYEIVEMNQFRPGASYAIFRKPGKQNPVVYKDYEITVD